MNEIKNATESELISHIIMAFAKDDEIVKLGTLALIRLRAKELGIGELIENTISEMQKVDKKADDEIRLDRARKREKIRLARTSSGAPYKTIDNFLLVLEGDEKYANVKFNVLKNAPEDIGEGGEYHRWADADSAESKRYIEKEYGIHQAQKHDDAMRILFRRREYHPIQQLMKDFEWDGVPRCEEFLTKWMKAEDTPYVREVSRLIFAGGINRLYNPGCKFDDMPVLIGTSQGEGKSTIVRWLNMSDEFFNEVTEFDGQRGIEQLDGGWICEVSELLALTKQKEQEAVKGYLTRQVDKIRRPFDRSVTDYPRRCIFIGTTNNEQFLRDKTGNRRFYPVHVYSSGYELFSREAECREYIKQCWAEAKAKYELGEMPCVANEALRDMFLAAQEDAMEDDWRVGVIEAYLARKGAGELVCVKMIADEALSNNPAFPMTLTKKDSLEIGAIMARFEDWERIERKRFPKYGSQKGWKKRGEDKKLPFKI